MELVGIFLMVLGIYFYRTSLALVGAGSFFLMLLMIESFFVFERGVPDSQISEVLTLSVFTSLLVGYIMGYFPKAGVFCMGGWLGLILSLTLNNVGFYYINSNPQNLTFYIVAPVLSVASGVLTVCLSRKIIMVASCKKTLIQH